MTLRNFAYDRSILKSYTGNVKIISAGNISTGGSGKTPLVIHIASRLLSFGYRIAIISRGYKRKSKGVNVVFDGKTIISEISNSGDEAYMTVNSLIDSNKGFYFLNAENRAEAVKYIENNFKVDFIILDDAFQHRGIHRDVDIVLIDSKDFTEHRFDYRFLLPAGKLREPFRSIKRSSVIIQNNKVYRMSIIPELEKMNLPLFRSEYSSEGIFDINKNEISPENKDVLAFSVIANPDSFIDLIKFKGGIIYKSLTFPDHYNYTGNDIDNIINLFKKDSLIITTEKDYVKISRYENFIKNYPVYYLKIGLRIENENEFFKLITEC